MCHKQLPIDKADNYEASIMKLKAMSIKNLSIVSQKLFTLPADERQVCFCFLPILFLFLNFSSFNDWILIFFCHVSLQDYIEYHAERELQRLPTIVAMATILRSATSSSSISSLVLASESGDIIILDTQTFTILHQVTIWNYDV